jgi:Leucine-rich repeat (LRR) protein
LDNNIIEKIENIDHLTNLKWLDLSFNRIKTIEGLDKLVNLTDLTLYNNQITFIDGLHNCNKLNIFSIGNNLIRSFEEVLAYFGRSAEKKTRFKYLQVLNVYGNPFTIKDGERDR